jgi:dTDP-4-dehydrorhamnose 3,5-epimerase
MEIINTPLSGCFLLRNKLFYDGRGYFFESFNHQKFCNLTGWQGNFVQDNQSESEFGVIRGLHFQKGEFAQAKLVRVIKGKVLDVAVDLRPDSPTRGQHYAVILSDDNENQLFIPRGFAHGFAVLSPTATFFYKCDNYYNKAAEGGIHPFDPTLAIDWMIDPKASKLSEKDMYAPSYLEFLALNKI